MLFEEGLNSPVVQIDVKCASSEQWSMSRFASCFRLSMLQSFYGRLTFGIGIRHWHSYLHAMPTPVALHSPFENWNQNFNSFVMPWIPQMHMIYGISVFKNYCWNALQQRSRVRTALPQEHKWRLEQTDRECRPFLYKFLPILVCKLAEKEEITEKSFKASNTSEPPLRPLQEW